MSQRCVLSCAVKTLDVVGEDQGLCWMNYDLIFHSCGAQLDECFMDNISANFLSLALVTGGQQAYTSFRLILA